MTISGRRIREILHFIFYFQPDTLNLESFL